MQPFYDGYYTCSESLASFDDFEDEFCKGNSSKRKTRNQSEKKRRDQFNMLINELSAMVSVNKKKMDKSTVLKSTISFLKNHQEISTQSHVHEITEDWKPSFLSNEEFSQLMLEALASFVMVFDQQGKILYVSESVTSLLGYLPQDLLNQSLYSIMYGKERVQLQTLLASHKVQGSISGSSGSSSSVPDINNPNNQLTFNCHLKRRSLNPSAPFLYEYVSFTGCSTKLGPDTETLGGDEQSLYSSQEIGSFCCAVKLLTSQILQEIPMMEESTCEFSSRLSMEWKFLYLDHRASPIIGYLPFEVLGTSGYNYYHTDDLGKISECHKQLLKAGEGSSCCYRFLTKGQQWIWIRSSYYITYNQWNSKPEFIVCNNAVVSYSDVKAELCSDLGYNEDKTWTEDAKLQERISLNSPTCSVSSSGNLDVPSGEHQSSSAVLSTDVEKVQQPHSTNSDSLPLHKIVSNQLGNLLQHYIRQQTETRQFLVPQQRSQSLSWSSASSKCQTSPSTSYTTSANQISHSKRDSEMKDSFTDFTAPIARPRPAASFSTIQRNLHEQLLQKSDMLQQAIQRQQNELQAITQQLAMTQDQVQQNSQTSALPVSDANTVQVNIPMLSGQLQTMSQLNESSITGANQHHFQVIVQSQQQQQQQHQQQQQQQQQQQHHQQQQQQEENDLLLSGQDMSDALLSSQRQLDAILSNQRQEDLLLSGQQGDLLVQGQQQSDDLLSQQQAEALMTGSEDVSQYLVYQMDTQD